ncbi:hypothetical protein EZS27_003850 [termite gut metagenome]|uniref:Outer membrane protein beta-barrel domain-containing protein n=1 Tax=termite gut metagenome TaxID=433724 RepID=A0A5J4SRH5_9ZZZZ
MKRITLLLFVLIPIICMAQMNDLQDTTIYAGNRKLEIKEKEGKIKVKIYEQLINSGDTIENEQIFEGVYRNGQSTERRISIPIPFTKNKKASYQSSSFRNFNHHRPHIAGISLGYSQFGNRFLSGQANGPDLVMSKSWEWEITPFKTIFPLTRDNSLSLNSGLGIGYTSFRLDGNYGFRKVGTNTAILPPDEGQFYSQSRLRYNNFRIPLVLEWQKFANHRGPIFFSIGCEGEIRWKIASKVKYGDKHEKTLNNNLNVNPIGMNLLAQAGYNHYGFYFRYSTFSLFQKNKGPELYPFSIGVCRYWGNF